MNIKATTRPQREAVLKLFRRDFPNWSPTFRLDPRTNRQIKVPTLQYRQFRKRFRWYFNEYIGGEWQGMFVGIEKDGYTHT